MIRSFGDGDTEAVWNLTFTKRISRELDQAKLTSVHENEGGAS